MLNLRSYSSPDILEAFPLNSISDRPETGKIILILIYISAKSQKSCFHHSLGKCDFSFYALRLAFLYVNLAELIDRRYICFAVRIGYLCIVFVKRYHLRNCNGCFSHYSI